MKLITEWVMSAGLVLAATAANAQVLAPYEIAGSRYSVASDVDGPYVGMPPEPPGPRYGGPMLLPPMEVYAIVRENGFSPLGIPRLRGFVYMISVINRDGDDGRLVIDGRTGRIIRFMPADRMGDNLNEDMSVTYGPAGPLPPIISAVRGAPRPPASVPHVASRTPSVPLPKAPPPRAGEPPKPLAAKPAPVQATPADAQAAVPAAVEAKPAAPQIQPTQQSAAVQAKPADAAQTVPQAAAPAAVEAKPAAPPIQPTQEMPKVQGLE